MIFALLFASFSWGSDITCPPPRNFPELSASQMEKKYKSSKVGCEKFSLAYGLFFSGERFQIIWGIRAMDVLVQIGDHASLATYALQIHELLAFSDPNREAFHFYALQGVNGVLAKLPIEHDQQWIHWALGVDRNTPGVGALSFHSFLVKYPKSNKIGKVQEWNQSAVEKYYVLEKSIADGLLRLKKYFAPIGRFEFNLKLPSLFASKSFHHFLWQTVIYREVFRSNLKKIDPRDLRVWLKLDGNETIEYGKFSEFIRKQNCTDLKKVFDYFPQAVPTKPMSDFLDLCVQR